MATPSPSTRGAPPAKAFQDASSKGLVVVEQLPVPGARGSSPANIHVAATRLREISTSRPRRRRDSSEEYPRRRRGVAAIHQRNIHVAAAEDPSSEYPHGERTAAVEHAAPQRGDRRAVAAREAPEQRARGVEGLDFIGGRLGREERHVELDAVRRRRQRPDARRVLRVGVRARGAVGDGRRARAERDGRARSADLSRDRDLRRAHRRARANPRGFDGRRRGQLREGVRERVPARRSRSRAFGLASAALD